MTLQEQIRSMWGGQWDQGGFDQSQALAAILQRRGISDLSKLQITPTTKKFWHPGVAASGGSEEGGMPYQEGRGAGMYDAPTFALSYDGKPLDASFLGDYNNDGTTSDGNPGNGVDNAMSLGWSANGGGNTKFLVEFGPDGKPRVVPSHASSSFMDSDLGLLAKGGALAATMYFGGNALQGLLPGGEAATTALSSADKAALFGNGGYAGYAGNLDKLALLGDAGYAGYAGNLDKLALLGDAGYGAGMTGAETSLFDTGMGVGAAGGGGGGPGGWMSQLGGIAAGAGIKDLAKLGLAIGGAFDSRDGTSTTTKDPWGPAQPFLLGQLQRGERMQQQLEAQPFSPAQQQAYGNVAGLLNLANSQAPAMLAAQGNVPQFKRGGGLLPPRGTGMDAAALNQGLLQFFGGR